MTGLSSMMSNFLTGGVTGAPDANGIVWTTPTPDSLPGMMQNGLNLGTAASDLFGGIFKGVGSLVQGNQDASALKMQAQEQDLQAQQEEIKGKQGANNIMENLIQTIASQRLAFSANGFDPNFGTPNATRNAAVNIADRQIDETRTNALLNSLSRRRQAAADLMQAGNTLSSSGMTAGADIFSGAVKAGGDITSAALTRINRG